MDTDWLTVAEAAERLNTSEQMVRRYIREGRLFAERVDRGSRSAYRVDARQVGLEAIQQGHRALIDAAGIVTGYGGTPEADAAFLDKVPADARDAVGAAMSRSELIEMFARELEEHRDELGFAFTTLDDEEQFEKEAQWIAQRVSRAERLQRRVQEIVDDD